MTKTQRDLCRDVTYACIQILYKFPDRFFFGKRTEHSKGNTENRRQQTVDKRRLQHDDAKCNSSAVAATGTGTRTADPCGLLMALTTCRPSFPIPLEQWNIYETPSLPLSLSSFIGNYEPYIVFIDLCVRYEPVEPVHCHATLWRTLTTSFPKHTPSCTEKKPYIQIHIYTYINNHNDRLKQYAGRGWCDENLVVIAGVFKADSKLNHVTVSSAIHIVCS